MSNQIKQIKIKNTTYDIAVDLKDVPHITTLENVLDAEVDPKTLENHTVNAKVIKQLDDKMTTNITTVTTNIQTVKDDISNLKTALQDVNTVMNFRGAVEATSEITDPKNGDVVVITEGEDAGKEYVYNGTTWIEIGDESRIAAAETELDYLATTTFPPQIHSNLALNITDLKLNESTWPEFIEAGTKLTKITGTLAKTGKITYTYGPDNIEINLKNYSSELSIDSNTFTSTLENPSFELNQLITDGSRLILKSKADYEASKPANTIFGKESEVKASGSIEAADKTVIGSLLMFFGTFTEIKELDDINFRSESATIIKKFNQEVDKKANHNATFSIPIAAETKQICFALPEGYKITSIKDNNDSNTEIITGFTENTDPIKIEDIGNTEHNYRVYFKNITIGTTKDNSYTITIKKVN